MPMLISKPGFGIETTDPRNLVFDSERNHLKTFSSGSFQRSFSSSGQEQVNITHSLGYRPLVLAYFRKTSGNTYFICGQIFENFFSRLGIGTPIVDVGVRVTTSQVQFILKQESSGSSTIEVRYEIFYEGS